VNDGTPADVVVADVVLGAVVAADVAVLFEPPQPATIAATATSTTDMALNLMKAFPTRLREPSNPRDLSLDPDPAFVSTPDRHRYAPPGPAGLRRASKALGL
jgi:hypothetical protein